MLYDIVGFKNKFFIRLGNVIPSWQTGFSSIECARKFAESHDLDSATADKISYSSDDLEWIVETYGFTKGKDSKWHLRVKNNVCTLCPGEYDLLLSVSDGKYVRNFNSISEITKELDSLQDYPIMSSEDVAKFLNLSIFAASTRKFSTSNLVRVKSSNIWAIGLDVKVAGSNKGDLYIQFKGKNGGPENIYMYYDVPTKVYRQLVASPSKGHYFWKMIRNNYMYRKLTGDKRTHLKNGIN